MAGETNLQKIKEVAKYFYKNKKAKATQPPSPATLKRIHEFINDCPELVRKDDIHYMTGTAVHTFEFEE